MEVVLTFISSMHEKLQEIPAVLSRAASATLPTPYAMLRSVAGADARWHRALDGHMEVLSGNSRWYKQVRDNVCVKQDDCV